MESALKAATAEERIVNKAAFLHVLSSLVGSGVTVTTEKHVVGGVFYTATPYKTNNFLVAIKVSRIEEVRDIEKDVCALRPFLAKHSTRQLPQCGILWMYITMWAILWCIEHMDP